MRFYFILLLFLSLCMSACTTSRWIIEDEPVLDTSTSELVDSYPVLKITRMPTPDNPSLFIEAFENRVFESPMRLQASRVIQRYRPRYGWMAVGVLGAAGIVYVANSDGFFENELTKTQKNVMYGAAGGILALTFLNMKPYGEPRYTGERRFLNQVGTEIRSNIDNRSGKRVEVIINAAHDGEALVTGLQRSFTSTLDLNLISELNLRSFSPDKPGIISMQLTTEYDVQEISFPVEDVLKRYVRIARRNTPLRSSPVVSQNNIITTVAETSLLPWVETTADGWHRVLLGITPTFVQVTDGALVWRPSVSSESDLVITTSNNVFGSVDVERNIPRATVENHQAIAILIGNQDYQSASLRNENALRSLQLMKTYLRESLGYQEDRIIFIENFGSDENAGQLLNIDREERTILGRSYSANSDVFVYFVGSGGIIQRGGRNEPAFLPVDGLPGDGIPVRELFNELRTLPSQNIRILIEADFSYNTTSEANINNQVNHRELAGILTQNKSGSWVIFASDNNQLAGKYVSSDRRTNMLHGITTYYFCRAIQDGNSSSDLIIRYMERNITFTSRRLHNRPQDPVFVGSRDAVLLRVTTP